MTCAVLMVRDEKGDPRPAVRSIFPALETDLQASTFDTPEEAELFLRRAQKLLGHPVVEICECEM